MQNCQMKHHYSEEQQSKGCEEQSVGTPDPSQLEGTSSKEPQLYTSTESTHPPIGEKTAMVDVIVRHEYNFIKFEICPKCGANNIFEEVITEFGLNRDTFKIIYTDEVDENVLVIDNDDLQLCPKFNIPTYKTCGPTPNTCIYLCVYMD